MSAVNSKAAPTVGFVFLGLLQGRVRCGAYPDAEGLMSGDLVEVQITKADGHDLWGEPPNPQ